jgi:hypothetical protein
MVTSRKKVTMRITLIVKTLIILNFKKKSEG